MPSIAEALKLTRLGDSREAAMDTRILLQAVLDCALSEFMAWPEKLLTCEQYSLFEDYLDRRLHGEPVAHIIGKAYFWDLELAVSPRTLIPRQDTETLIEAALSLPFSYLNMPSNVLDLGTGTGAIALSIAQELARRSGKACSDNNCAILGVDFSQDIVELARRNAQANGLEGVEFMVSDWFDDIPASEYELIVSNPPYIEENDPHLSQGDLRFEARTALASGVDGLDDIRHIIREASSFLSNQGWLCLEHGYNQARSVAAIFIENGYRDVRLFQDLGGNDRVTCAQYCQGA